MRTGWRYDAVFSRAEPISRNQHEAMIMQRLTVSWDLPEDHSEFMDAYNGWRWKLIVSELDEWLRREIKYKDREGFQEVRERLHEIVDAEGLRIWD